MSIRPSSSSMKRDNMRSRLRWEGVLLLAIILDCNCLQMSFFSMLCRNVDVMYSGDDLQVSHHPVSN